MSVNPWLSENVENETTVKYMDMSMTGLPLMKVKMSKNPDEK